MATMRASTFPVPVGLFLSSQRRLQAAGHKALGYLADSVWCDAESLFDSLIGPPFIFTSLVKLEQNVRMLDPVPLRFPFAN